MDNEIYTDEVPFFNNVRINSNVQTENENNLFIKHILDQLNSEEIEDDKPIDSKRLWKTKKTKSKLYNSINNKTFQIDCDISELKIKNLKKKVKKALEEDNRFSNLKKIGSGTYGIVFSAFDMKLNHDVAIKVQLKHPYNKDLVEFEGKILDEVNKFIEQNYLPIGKAYDRFEIPFILKDKSENPIDFTFSITIADLANSSFEKILDECEDNKTLLDEFTLYNIKNQLMKGLQILHSNLIVHLDIKSDNILCFNLKSKLMHRSTFNSSWEKISLLADFGCAIEFPELRGLENTNWEETIKNFNAKTELRGTLVYMAPKLREAYKSNKYEVDHNPFKSDLYSLGMLLLEAFTVGRRPLRLTDEIVDIVNDEKDGEQMNKKIKELVDNELAEMRRYFVELEVLDDSDFNDLKSMLEEDEDKRGPIIYRTSFIE